MIKYGLLSLFFFFFSLGTLKTRESQLSHLEYVKYVEDEERLKRLFDEYNKRVHEVNLDFFKNKMAKLESNYSYTVVNSYGYMGRYQFGMSTLSSLVHKGYLNLGRKTLTRTNFIHNPELQERAMDALIEANLESLSRYNALDYEGTEVGGVLITRHGLLAASHLMGVGSMNKYLKSLGKINKADANGTSVKDYLIEFA